MMQEFLYKPEFKKVLSSILGRNLYLKLASIPNSTALISLRKLSFDLGLGHPYHSLPVAVAIEINGYCNRKCPYCPNSKFDLRSDKAAIMSEKLFCKIIDELAELKYYRTIYFNIYNEPLTDKRLPDFVEYARNKLPKATIEIYTNGDHLDYALYCLLKEKKVDRFIVSVHGENLPLNFAGTLSKLPEREKAGNIIIRNMHDAYKNGQDVFYNRGGAIRINKRSAGPKPCEYILACNIDHTGKVILCCNDYFGKHVFGNVNDQSLFDIWFDKKYMELRNRIALQYRDLSICRECNV